MWLKRDYDLIVINWVLKELDDTQVGDLLNTLRKHLNLNRKDQEKNGVILIKEPIKTKDKSLTTQPYRTEERLRDLISKEFTIKFHETISSRKTGKKDGLIYFPKQAVFVGQWDARKCFQNNQHLGHELFRNEEEFFEYYSPKFKNRG